MSRARRAFAVLNVIAWAAAALAPGADAQDSAELFPLPTALEPAVSFWTRVYTEIDTDAGFIHDSLKLDIVYETLSVPGGDSGARERRRRVDRALETYRKILIKLGTGARTGLNDAEQRVLALFPAEVKNSELKAAAERLRFQLGQADRFRAGLERAGTWKPYIYSVLDSRGLPRELAALPHVESSYDPTAYSKVGAAGLWQFTRSTGVRYLRIDHIVDERRDPFFATAAAARLLEDNLTVLGSWPLALTAYNHGVSGMRCAVQQQQTSDIDVIVAKYQSRSFGFASRNFYAAFLAALAIDSNPEKYFATVRVAPPSETDVIVVPDFLEISTLADTLDLRTSRLRELNPALADGVWAGDKLVPKGFELRVPRATAAGAAALLAGIDPRVRHATQRPDLEHRVRRGDTLSGIAAAYRVSLAALLRANGLSTRDLIRVGQVIKLPTTAAGAPTVALAAAAPTVQPEDPAPNAAPPRAAAASGPTGPGDTYVVRNGDTIAGIAKRLGVQPDALVATNSLRDANLIHPGQTLQVPGRPAPEPAVPTLAQVAAIEAATIDVSIASSAAMLVNVAPPADDGVAAIETGAGANALASFQAALAADPSDYSVAASDQIQVQALETLGHYADWLEIPTQRLRDLNGLAFRDTVVAGQLLKLDFSQVDAAAFEQRRVAFQQQLQSEFFAVHQIEDIEDHVVRAGESLWLLAARTYKVPVWLLRQYNPDIDLDRVIPGTVVRFPKLRLIGDGAGETDRTPATVADNTA